MQERPQGKKEKVIGFKNHQQFILYRVLYELEYKLFSPQFQKTELIESRKIVKSKT